MALLKARWKVSYDQGFSLQKIFHLLTKLLPLTIFEQNESKSPRGNIRLAYGSRSEQETSLKVRKL